MIDHATEIVRELLLREKDINMAVDMTAGNGHDSKFILDKLEPKKLFAFDIQQMAQESTKNLLADKENFTFILDSHANIDKYIKQKVDLVIFNLGYLPKGDKNITTTWKSTITAIKKSLELLSPRGKIFITVYPGHPAGKIESEKINEFLEDLDYKKYTVLKMNFVNKINNPPYVIVVGHKE
ncbi:class I SAM-dependent methyltransferase [Anaerococcus sp. ENR1011]|uniref:Class I SAM-dependent methyltransferase n=1 Tax=Anaerococcus groningensis TaxID=3115616 RepID=A0ABW9N1K0_9FIRM